QESSDALDTFGGKSMIVDYQGKILSEHGYGAGPSYAGAILDIEALRQYRTRSLWGNWLRDLRTEQFRCIYEQALYPKNLGIEKRAWTVPVRRFTRLQATAPNSSPSRKPGWRAIPIGVRVGNPNYRIGFLFAFSSTIRLC